MLITKRDGSKEEFNVEKIESAILKAFKACGIDPGLKDRHDIATFCEHIGGVNKEGLSVETIQDQVEKYLCKRCFPVGKAYMLYREQHKQARLTSDKLKYFHKYTESKDSATNLSNTDDNANSNKKNMATLEGELYKDTNRIIQRQWMKEMLAEIGSPYRDQYVKDLEHHIIYQHDETGGIKPYCSAYTLYPLLVDGTNNVDGTKNHAPHHLGSFVGQFQNLVFLLSAQKKGAGAYGEFFNFFSYFCEKEWGLEYYKKADVIITNEHCLEQKTIGQTIDQFFQSVTHYINQPAGNRGYQSPY
jgi:ribonucleoside-triphosphate reductase